MNLSHMRRYSVAIIAMFLALACNPQADRTGKPTGNAADKTTPQTSGDKLGLAKWAQADNARGFLHKESGIGFIYPVGWDNQGARKQADITSLGLRKDAGAIEVTLYWTPLDPDQSSKTIGGDELVGLRRFYGDKVNASKSVTAAGQEWNKLSIAGGPVGSNDPNLSGAVYVFAFRRDQQGWKIKVRATVRGVEKLEAVEGLLGNYRQE